MTDAGSRIARYVARIVAVAAYVLVVALGATGCGGDEATEPVTPSTAPPSTAPEPPQDVNAGACIDGTTSVDPGALQIIVSTLSAFVTSWVPPADDHTGGTAPIPALSLRVRKVLADSSVTIGGQVAEIVTPAVAGVAPKPEVTEVGYVDAVAAHTDQARAYDEAVGPGGAARVAADAGAQAIAVADWSADKSEVAGCFEALAATTSGPERRFVGLTDLDQNRPPQSGRADFTGAVIVVFHSGADVNQMSEQEAAFRTQWIAQGAADVRFLPPETIPTVLGPFLAMGVIP